MDKNTLSEYGWIIIVVIILAILIAFAVPFGNFVVTNINSNVDSLFQLFDDDQPVVASEHVHNFNQAIISNKYMAVPGTCRDKNAYYYSCSCGETGAGTFYGERDPVNHVGETKINYALSDKSQHTATVICKSCTGIINSCLEMHEYASSGICTKCGYARTLTSPSITIEGDILTITDAQNEVEYEIYADGALKTAVDSKIVDLSSLDFDYGEYDIAVKAKANGYNTSAESNSVTYVVEKSIFGLYESGTGYTKQLKSWDELVDEGIVTANGAVVQGKESLLVGNLMLPNTLTKISYNAFANCSGLTGVQFSNSVTIIRDNAFRGCTGINDVYFNGSLEEWCKICFESNGNPCTAGANLYFNGELATDIVIPDTISQIGNYLFIGCTSLTSVEIPGGVTKIGIYAFNKCSNISSITIEEGLNSVGMLAFSQCTNLKTVNYTGTIDDWCDIAFDNDGSNPCCGGASLYINGSQLTSVIVNNETTEIKKYAFDGCSSITDVVLSSAVTSVGKSAFRNCIELEEISVNSGVENFGMSAFANCANLKTVRYGGTVEQWCRITFGDRNGSPCQAGATVYIGETVVTEITVPSTITQINNFAFSGFTDLREVTISDSVTSIGENAFYECINLETFNMPAGITSIGQSAFFNCTKLLDVYYGGTLETWCDIMFGNITSNPCRYGANLYFNGTLVENVVIPESFSVVNDFAFAGCNSLKSIVIENGITSIGSFAFYSCSNLTSITIPTSVTSVGTSFFGICISLKDIYYSGTSDQWNAILFASDWDKGAYAYVVHCSDGDITKP